MADTSGLPPEGWYPDRPNATRLRHWNGTGWTNEFIPIAVTPAAPAGPAEPAVPAAPAVLMVPAEPVRETTEARSRRELRAQVGALVHGEPDTPPRGVAPVVVAPVDEAVPVSAPTLAIAPEPEPMMSSVDRARVAGGYAPTRNQAWQESFAAAQRLPTGSSQTFAGWLYATSPLWNGALVVAGMSALSIVNPLLVQGGLGVVAFAMTFLLARQDIRHLTERGYRAPSLWLVLLPFFYFVVRMVRVGMRGAAMVVAYLLSFVALVGLLYLAFIGNPALLSVLSPSVQAETSAIPTPVTTLTAQERDNLLTQAGTEAQVRLDLAKTWEVGSVECVPFPSIDAGTTTTCVVELDGAAYNAGLQLTPDEPSTAFVLTGMLPVVIDSP